MFGSDRGHQPQPCAAVILHERAVLSTLESARVETTDLKDAMKTTHILGGIAIAGLMVFSGCKKEELGTLKLDITYEVDGTDMAMNTIAYTNEAGYDFSVTKLVYYISNIKLVGDGVDDFQSDEIQYIDASNAATGQITLSDVPYGNYKGITFILGVDPGRNVTGGLPSTTENNNMAWPDQMGGGYHHMKFEGLWVNGVDTSGFLMHLGKTHQVNCDQNRAINLNSETVSHNLTMNLNEWFRTPAVYDFAVDGTSIMMNDAAMEKLARNGDDCFDN